MDNEIILDESVDVVVKFLHRGEPCVPVKFRRASGREVVVSELGLRTPMREGRKLLQVFDVTDGSADYRLVFDSERLTWRLTREADRW